MILGVDHIALSCKNIGAGIEAVQKMGYQVRFLQEGVINHAEKRPYLRHYLPEHSIAYCRSPRGVSLELTQHAAPLQVQRSAYQVLLEKRPDPFIAFTDPLPTAWGDAWTSVFPEVILETAVWQPFHAQVWHDVTPVNLQGTSVRGAMLPVTNLQTAERFWIQGLGCVVAKRGFSSEDIPWTQIVFNSPIPAWRLNVVLMKTEERTRLSCLDDAGFPCMALLTNRIHEDRERSLQEGATVASGVFSLSWGGRKLQVVLVRGPNGELVELVEVEKGTKEEDHP